MVEKSIKGSLRNFFFMITIQSPLPLEPLGTSASPVEVADFMPDSEGSDAPLGPAAESLSSDRASSWNRRKTLWGGVMFGLFLVFLIVFAIVFSQHLETMSYVMLGLSFGSVVVLILGCGIIECCEINSYL